MWRRRTLVKWPVLVLGRRSDSHPSSILSGAVTRDQRPGRGFFGWLTIDRRTDDEVRTRKRLEGEPAGVTGPGLRASGRVGNLEFSRGTGCGLSKYQMANGHLFFRARSSE